MDIFKVQLSMVQHFCNDLKSVNESIEVSFLRLVDYLDRVYYAIGYDGKTFDVSIPKKPVKEIREPIGAESSPLIRQMLLANKKHSWQRVTVNGEYLPWAKAIQKITEK